MVKCNHCGKEVPETAFVCGYCGTRLKPAPSKPDDPSASQAAEPEETSITPPQDISLDGGSAEDLPAQQEDQALSIESAPIEEPAHDVAPQKEDEIKEAQTTAVKQEAPRNKKKRWIWLLLIIPVGCLILAGIVFTIIFGTDPLLRLLPENWVHKPLFRTRIDESFSETETSILSLGEDTWISDGEYHWRMQGGGFSAMGLPYVPTRIPYWLLIGWRFVSTDSTYSSWGVDIAAVSADETEYEWYQVIIYPEYYEVYLTDQEGETQVLLSQPYESDENNHLRISAIPESCFLVEINDETADCLYLNPDRASYNISLNLNNETEIALNYILLHDQK